ncbi:hypothetical protein EJB05_10342, partial [Eragrostis curvula]
MAQQAVLFLVVVLVLLLLLLLRRRWFTTTTTTRRDHGLPPSPPGVKLPILGHLHLVDLRRPHVSLRDLADRHAAGDGLLVLQLGQVANLVVSSPRGAEAILRAHDHAFASRPPSAVSDILFSGGSDVALASYGEYWRQARKLVTTHLLSARKVHLLRRARHEETRLVLAKLRAAANVVDDVGDLLGTFVNDVVSRAVSGRLVRDEGRNRTFRELSAANGELLGGFNLDNYFPTLAKLLSFITPAGMACAEARRCRNRWDHLLDTIIDEHHRDEAPSSSSHDHQDDNIINEDDGDFIDVLLSLQHEYGLTRDQVKVILMDMFAAGTDTSSIVLEYAMIELIRNPHIMTKLRAEIISNTPREQDMVNEDNLNNMPYLKAVVKETIRLHPPVPLLLPRISMEKCHVNGYTIPAGMRVIVNAWALARDAKSWDKAQEFMPERFLDNNTSVDFMGRDFKFIPFGAGRRMCPGMNFGLATVEIMLANLLYTFNWELPPGTKKEDIDMTDVFGLTMHPKHKLKLVPRLM